MWILLPSLGQLDYINTIYAFCQHFFDNFFKIFLTLYQLYITLFIITKYCLIPKNETVYTLALLLPTVYTAIYYTIYMYYI